MWPVSAGAPGPAFAGPADTGPEWSTARTPADGVMLDDDCNLVPTPGYRAQYVPGVDAYGRPVIPTEMPGSKAVILSVGLDIAGARTRGRTWRYDARHADDGDASVQVLLGPPPANDAGPSGHCNPALK